jgi:monofunctional biosynthetic peptidoglycan transglycosylase
MSEVRRESINLPDMERKKRAPFFFAFCLIFGVVWNLFLYDIPTLFSIGLLKFAPPLSTSFMRHHSISYPLKRAERRWVPLDEISNYLKDAVVIAEDDKFFDHCGIDWEALKNAASTNWERKSFDFGGSTITQQLVKNLYLSPSKDPIRKIREITLALVMDSHLSKERILEIYLNSVEWGPGIFGAEAAARHYFKIPAKSLNAQQSAFLASILPNPVQRGQAGYRLTERAVSILRRIE